MKILALLLAIVLVLGGCAAAPEATPTPEGGAEKGITVVCTIFPPYDFARQLTLHTGADVRMLIKPGVESHTFDPSPSDILDIQKADLFVYIGGQDDAWVDTVLQGQDRGRMRALKLIDCVETLPEEHDHEEGERGEGEEHAEGIDEHIWTSPRNAKLMAQAIGAALMEIDPQQAEVYKTNLADYTAQLDALDQAFSDVVESGARREVVFGDRFPFRYFAKAYGLSWHAAFSNCSGEGEPSAADIASLIDRIKADGIPVVYHIEQGSVRTAQVIAGETGAEILAMHSCHNLTTQEFSSGVTYLELMRGNVEALRKGLS